LKILVVEDFEGFRRFLCSALQHRSDFSTIEASDGLEAVTKAEQLQPDLVLLDIGLPSLNGMEVARRIRTLAPRARILFVSLEFSPDVVRAALRLGALGYVHKLRAQSDLLPAIAAVLKGERFVSNGLEFHDAAERPAPQRHEIRLCASDAIVLDSLAGFIGAALTAGNAAIVWATESHHEMICQRLLGQGVDVTASIQRGTYCQADINEKPDLGRMLAAVHGLREAARRAGKEHPRIAVCGERAGRLWGQGKVDEAIHLEKLLNELARSPDSDILCPYPSPESEWNDLAFRTICAEHSCVSHR
jgi:DNA-binding NarL/FixJ family response regulator